MLLGYNERMSLGVTVTFNHKKGAAPLQMITSGDLSFLDPMEHAGGRKLLVARGGVPFRQQYEETGKALTHAFLTRTCFLDPTLVNFCSSLTGFFVLKPSVL